MRISIVTPTLNRAAWLPAAIESVLAQQHADFEHIVIDGLSTDDTVEVLARYPHLRVIREADRGLYDALNKGIAAATGDVVGHLNSDDIYLPGVFAPVAAAFADSALDVVSGGSETIDPQGRVLHRFERTPEIELSFKNATDGPATPNARFFRRNFLQRVGPYDLGYRVAADREFLFRAVVAQPRAITIEQLFYQYRWHEESLTFSDDPARAARWRDEYLQLAERVLDWPALPTVAYECARRWHLRESAQSATRSLLAGQPAAAWRYACRGRRRNPAWPIMFLRHLCGALLRP